MEVVAIDFNISTDSKIAGGNKFSSLVHIFILLSLQKWSLNNTRVLLSWLKNGNGIIRKIERNDESSVHIFWNFGVKSRCKSQDFLIVVYMLEEIDFWLLWD
jgi:hypothetical protein